MKQLCCVALWGLWALWVAVAQAQSPVERGEYLFRASGGCSCHTDLANGGAFMAGGRAIETPFGSIYATNITPDVETGIGRWSDADFVRAMREGIAPDGSHYYPVFPYTSFARMRERDILDLKAYLFSLPAVRKENPTNELPPPFSWRFTLSLWKILHFSEGEQQIDTSRSAQWNRGAYVVEALAHCAECHTPRTATGGLLGDMAFAGSVEGPEGEWAPNITPDSTTGVGTWSKPDMTWYLQTGLEPDGDSAQGLMWEVIEQGYQHLSEDDLDAVATYLQSLKPIENDLGKERSASD